MRDERGELIRNAHLVGFFRRICRLLYNQIFPVFVFDGATPALKKKTTAARRRQRDEQGARHRRIAEQMLMNQLKQRVLKDAGRKKNVAADGGAGAEGAGAGGFIPTEENVTLPHEIAERLGMLGAGAGAEGKKKKLTAAGAKFESKVRHFFHFFFSNLVAYFGAQFPILVVFFV